MAKLLLSTKRNKNTRPGGAVIPRLSHTSSAKERGLRAADLMVQFKDEIFRRLTAPGDMGYVMAIRYQELVKSLLQNAHSGSLSRAFRDQYDSFFMLGQSPTRPEASILNAHDQYFDELKRRYSGLVIHSPGGRRDSSVIATEVYKVMDLIKASGADAMHLSYASKLMHMVDETLPIYDSNVAAVTGGSNPDHEKRYTMLLDVQEFLMTEPRTDALMTELAYVPGYSGMSRAKLLDCLLFQCGRIVK